jgi:plastocyanin
MGMPGITKTFLQWKVRIDFEGEKMNRKHPPGTGIRWLSTVCVGVALMVVGVPLRTEAGSITGVVRAEGKKGAESDAACGKYDSREFKFVERMNYAEMKDFVVYIEGAVGTNAEPPSKPAQVITKRVLQHGAMFTPHVLPIMVGTTVEWPNNDDILHNVFSFSEAKQFDLGLYKSPEVGRVVFEKSGRVDVFCSIHTRMNCIVLVLENPYFAATNDRGSYTIANVPAGTYKLKAWHERLPSRVEEVKVPETGEVKVDFTLGIINLPKS